MESTDVDSHIQTFSEPHGLSIFLTDRPAPQQGDLDTSWPIAVIAT
jgi:hypothetical protein